MHTIRNNCGYEFVKLCLRYTARDPRLRSYVWWLTAETSLSNNCGELMGGQIRTNYILANAQLKQQTASKSLSFNEDLIEIKNFFNRKEFNFF